ncbi:MAG: lysine--tRNA ligase [Candidatus Methanosuratus sp.]|nr:lysine--tRNA ligase [Candidatus Methanosuratincola sp.]
MGRGHWVRGIVEEIIKRDDEKIVIHTGKTPSGPIHIGAEREQFICSAIQRELKRRGFESTFNLIIDSYDPIKSIPAALTVPEWFEEELGKPLSSVPDPFGCHGSYAHHFADEFIRCQPELGLSPNIIYTHELYTQPAMKDAIRTVLRRLDQLKAIRRKYLHLQEEDGSTDDWNPVMVVCEKCGRIASMKKEVIPNRLDSWDLVKDELTYTCSACGHKGRGKIGDLPMKLSWRVDWSAKWAVFKVSCEPAGKDHCVKDGAYDMGLEVCKEIFGYRGPLRVPYEWLTLGEHAMKTHKGITFTPMEWLKVAPPEALRYLILSVDPMRHISFLPERIPDIVDSFDRMERQYYGIERIPENTDVEYINDLYRLCVKSKPEEEIPARLPYRFATTIVQLEPLLGAERILSKSAEYAARLRGKPGLTPKEFEDAKMRLSMAAQWVIQYAPPQARFKISDEPAFSTSDKKERQFLESVAQLVGKAQTESELQNEIFNAARSIGLDPSRAFAVLYQILIGSEKGPRLAPLLLALDRDWLIKRLRSGVRSTSNEV